MTTITVSIGRAVPAKASCPAHDLSDNQWGRFIARTEAIVLGACNSFDDIHFTGEGRGWYKGQAETSFTIIASIDAGLLAEVEARLSILAHLYGQEAIAVTSGTTNIVEAKRGRR